MRGRDLKTTDMGLCCQQRRGYIRQRIRGWLIRAEDKEVPQSTRFGEEWRETEDSQRGLERIRRSCRRRGAGSDGSHGESCSESLQKRHETRGEQRRKPNREMALRDVRKCAEADTAQDECILC